MRLRPRTKRRIPRTLRSVRPAWIPERIQHCRRNDRTQRPELRGLGALLRASEACGAPEMVQRLWCGSVLRQSGVQRCSSMRHCHLGRSLCLTPVSLLRFRPLSRKGGGRYPAAKPQTKTATNKMKTLTQLRASFWGDHPEFAALRRSRKRQNDYDVNIRMAWVDYIDAMQRDGTINDALAGRATL